MLRTAWSPELVFDVAVSVIFFRNADGLRSSTVRTASRTISSFSFVLQHPVQLHPSQYVRAEKQSQYLILICHQAGKVYIYIYQRLMGLVADSNLQFQTTGIFTAAILFLCPWSDVDARMFPIHTFELTVRLRDRLFCMGCSSTLFAIAYWWPSAYSCLLVHQFEEGFRE